MKLLPKAAPPVKLSFSFEEEESALKEAIEQRRHWEAKVESKRKAIDEIKARIENERLRFEEAGSLLNGGDGDSEKLEKLIDRYHKSTSSLNSDRTKAGLELAMAEKGAERQLEQVRAAQEVALQAIEEAARAELVKINDAWLAALEVAGRSVDEAIAVRSLARAALRGVATKMEHRPGDPPPDSVAGIRLEHRMPLIPEFNVNIAGSLRVFKLDRLGVEAIKQSFQERGAASA